MSIIPQDDDFLTAVSKITGNLAPNISTGKRSLSQAEIEDALRRGGWPEQHIPKMSAIAMGEGAVDPEDRSRRLMNSFNPGVGPGGVPTKEKSAGPFQINLLAHPQYDKQQLLSDPVYGAKAAYDVFKAAGNSFHPWGAYTQGSWKKYYKGRPSGTNEPDFLSKLSSITGQSSFAVTPESGGDFLSNI